MAAKRKWTDGDLCEAVRTSRSIGQVLDKLGIRRTGGSYVHVQKHIVRLGLDASHFVGQGWSHEDAWAERRRATLERILVAGSTGTKGHGLKLKLFREGLKAQQCEWCGITEWRGLPAPLELDHINGDRDDNRLENLRILCPNCHAQTDTYGVRNKRKTA